jgi:hypothetical protein
MVDAGKKAETVRIGFGTKHRRYRLDATVPIKHLWSKPAERAKGTVNLPNGGRAKTGFYPLALRGDAQFGDLAPHDHRLGTKRSIVGWLPFGKLTVPVEDDVHDEAGSDAPDQLRHLVR